MKGEGRPFDPGAVVVVYLSDPPAKMWGILRSLDATGVALEGIDVRSFDDFATGVAGGDMVAADLSLVFYPLARVEKILADRGTESAPSLSDQFRARVGISLPELVLR